MVSGVPEGKVTRWSRTKAPGVVHLGKIGSEVRGQNRTRSSGISENASHCISIQCLYCSRRTRTHIPRFVHGSDSYPTNSMEHRAADCFATLEMLFYAETCRHTKTKAFHQAAVLRWCR